MIAHRRAGQRSGALAGASRGRPGIACGAAALRRSLTLLLCLPLLSGCAQVRETPVDVDLDGRRLHLLLVSDGRPRPAVVLESGLGGGVGWPHTRAALARSARVVTYDRAGYGGSAAGPEPRDAHNVARDLHAALHQAGVAPPYVLVGQSFGGIFVQVFAALYPDETAGLVLVDPTWASEDVCYSMDQVREWFLAHAPQDWPRVAAACRGAPAGLAGFLGSKYRQMAAYIESAPAAERNVLRQEWWAMIDHLVGDGEPWQVTGGALAESQVMAASIRQAIAARPLPRVPAILLAAERIDLDALPPDRQTPQTAALRAAAQRWRLARYEEWVQQTPGARLTTVPGSGHDIESDRPQAVVDAIRAVLGGW